MLTPLRDSSSGTLVTRASCTLLPGQGCSPGYCSWRGMGTVLLLSHLQRQLSWMPMRGVGTSLHSPQTSKWSQAVAQTRDVCLAYRGNIPLLLEGHGLRHGPHWPHWPSPLTMASPDVHIRLFLTSLESPVLSGVVEHTSFCLSFPPNLSSAYLLISVVPGGSGCLGLSQEQSQECNASWGHVAPGRVHLRLAPHSGPRAWD